tara:strand:- start:3819 stop:4214 length:396 start_codon:yes stop_codon:yes gene_type:complete
MNKHHVILGPKRSPKVDLAKKIASDFRNSQVFWSDARRFISKNTHPFSHIDASIQVKLIILDNIGYAIPDYKLKELVTGELIVNKPNQKEFTISPQYILIFDEEVHPKWLDPSVFRRFIIHDLFLKPPIAN